MKNSLSFQLAWLTSATTVIPALAAAILIAAPLATGEEVEVFRSGSPTTEAAAASASSFGKDAVVRIEPAKDKPLQLRLRDLPKHQFLKIDAVIDMNEVGGYGAGVVRILGAGVGGGAADPNSLRGRFQVAVDGKQAVDSSFGGQMGAAAGGSFPDLADQFLHLPGTGSANGPVKVQGADGKLRLRRIAGGAGADKMKEHRVTFVIPHTGDEADLEFRWVKAGGAKAGAGAIIAIAGMGGKPSAPFSIKSLTASVFDAPLDLDAAGFSQRYEALGAENPVDAMDALNDLISAGHSVLPMLQGELHKKGDPEIEKKFAEALKAMDSPDFETRAGAAKALAELGKDVIPLARRALVEEADSLSAEVKNTLKNLTDRIEKGSTALAENSRINRTHRLLDTLGGDEAQKLKSSLPEPTLVVDPELASTIKAGAGGAPGVIEMDFGGLKGVDGGGGAIFKFKGGALKVEGGAGRVEAIPLGEAKAVPAEPAVPKKPGATPKEK